MARTRSVDFLPEIFQTSTNKQFLSATLDQLIQEPKFKRIQGYVGRRTGPGVNADDSYVAETTASRAEYQLEPGVILRDDTNSQKIADAITYPGITDALGMQGALTNRQDRLYTSEYYAWDPFVDFDKFINYSQYYWLPEGPQTVDVFSGTVPLTDNFVVTRENGVYTFSGVAGNNPQITLVRGGNYTFQVAQNQKETINFRVNTQGTNAWVIDYQVNPTLTLVRGNTYVFTLVSALPIGFYIKTQQTLGINNLYEDGVTGNGNVTGTITFVVPQDAPDTLYYNSSTQINMQGQLNVVDAAPGTGPGFWIQTDPGVNGRIPATPNISSRDVLGVINNGEDLGTVTFNVPQSNAQDFYYNLTPISFNSGKVDLLTDLQFDQLNNVFVDQFLAANPGGIDGITNLNNRTVVFTESNPDPVGGGWENISQFDPLPNAGNVVSGLGSFDSTAFAQTTPIANVDIQRSVWQIQYVTSEGGGQYMQLISVAPVNQFEKFAIQFGQTWSNTSWFKNSQGYFEKIPLLTANLDTLYYQDGTDPEIFGRFKMINQELASTLDVDDIIGSKNYTSPNGVIFTNGLKVQFIGEVIPAEYQGNSYYVEGVGTAIQLLPVTNFVTPETYTQSATIPYDSIPYDIGNYDATLNAPLVPDYLTINRASPDLNAWTRSNRWFHIDVIQASAQYNNLTPTVDNLFRARRPILEFRAGTRLFDYGTQGKQPVDVIDFAETDALSTINGSIGYTIDGYSLISGSRVIFAADTDPQVRNKIYVVEFIIPDSVPPLIAQPIINLTPAADGDVLYDQVAVCLSGQTQQGLSFWFDGVDWIPAQQKSSVNQAPYFNVYDIDNISFANIVKYPGSNFRGSKLFSYAQGSGTTDTVLGFPVKYLSLANIGDIVFDNNLYTDTFIYTKDNASSTVNVSTGNVHEYANRTSFVKEIGWQTAITPSRSRQQFQFSYDGSPLLLDVSAIPNGDIPSIQIFAGSQYVEPSGYTVEATSDSTTITLNNIYAPGTIIEVAVLSDQASKVAFYQVPLNLGNNPLNVNSDQFTLGTARQHYETICENLLTIVGPINGSNNTRDLGNIIPYGTNIIQNSSPMTLAGYFMRSQQYNIFSALDYSSREYEQYKAQLLENVIRNDYTNFTIPQMLTAVVTDLVAGRTNLNPFYWTDMLPASNVYAETRTVYTVISTPTFQLNTTYDFTSSNYQSVLVYVNDHLLTFGYDYEVASDSPRLTITVPLSPGDVIVIQEYATTYGTFVPATPTKLGLYPAYKPEIYLDTSYVSPTFIILGHDGSKTVAFGDFRDNLLLEFETRIYNNLKVKSPIPLTLEDVVPGQFRTTDYSLAEVNQILAPEFLSWIGWNKLAYQVQDFVATNQFTWNYSASGNKLSGPPQQPMPAGAWRGIYQYYYDTIDPSRTPWEMLGFSEKPTWWEGRYGPAPYTSGNLVLWDDLSLGYVADPVEPYILPKYARSGLQSALPVDSEGQLLSPFESVVGYFDSSQFEKSWVFGDQGPVEYSWRASSAYPFAVMRLLALTRPAEFFSLFADRDLYKFDLDYDQYLLNKRYRLDANGVEVYGNGVSKASFINFIVDFNQQLGRDTTTKLTTDLTNLDVRLCYRMGAFTDKQYTQIYTERSSPNSINSSLLLPPESYNLLLYKNQPFARTTYSSVIVQVVENGYAVYGYSITNPYFDILVSKTGGIRTVIEAGGTTVTVPNTYSTDVAQVPYGYVFTNQTVVCDFLLSYGALLQSQGMTFNEQENGKILNWNQMAQEFLYWSSQGWAVGSIIGLNPTNTNLTVTKALAVVDNATAQTIENQILDQNRTTLPVRDLVVDRFENTFKITSLSSQTISFMDLQYTSYETMIVLDNVSIFADLLYNPATGARQNRVYVSASVSAEWNGQLDAQGFILNDTALVQNWQPYKNYAKGEIVIYKNNYWSAQTIVQPAAEFRYNDWVKSDYTKIQRGLLQNIANKADQLANSYDVNQANLNLDNDLLSYGLIGFRPRQYMTSLNLNDVSQVNVYQQFIRDKGDIRSVRLLANANLGKEVAQYSVYENWAILRSIYGANANRSFIELRLNQALATSNPFTVQVVEPLQSSLANQTILLNDIWRESYQLANTDILPTYYPQITDTALPSAGYVNLDDVDITVFSLDAQLGTATGVLDTIGVGTIVWAAKSNAYDWNVYQASTVSGRIVGVTPNLNGTSTITFNGNPGLAVNDIVIIRYFDASVDGVYRVLARPSVTSIVIALADPAVTIGQGLAYYLQTQRVAQASDTLNLPYSTRLIPGDKVWVDNNGAGHWEVLEKQQPFTSRASLEPQTPTANSGFGTSVAQGWGNEFALIGTPNYSGVGSLACFARNEAGAYAQVFDLTLDATGASGYGNSLEIGYQSWAIAGASASDGNNGYATVIYHVPVSTIFEQTQLLVTPDLDFNSAEFGYSVTMSQDERWIYVGAPGRNKVYAYGRIDVESQSIEFITDGIISTFNTASAIQISDGQQLLVVLDDVTLIDGVDYLVSGSTVQLLTTPAADLVLSIRRKSVTTFTGDGSTAVFDLEPYLYTATNIYSFKVLLDGVIQRPELDYDFNSDSSLDQYKIVFVSAPTNGASISVTAADYFEFVETLTVPGLLSTARFGQSVSTTTDGRQVMIGAINDSADNDHPRAGSCYVFDRSATRYLVDDVSVLTYAMPAGWRNPVAVLLNNEYLTNTNQFINGQFSVVGNDIVIASTVTLNVGDVLEIESNIFTQVQKITANEPFDEADFGAAVDVCPTNCSIYTGAPNDGSVLPGAGNVQRNVNQARIYGTITATVADPTLNVGDTLQINNFTVEVPVDNTVSGLADAINTYSDNGVVNGIPNVYASVNNGYLTLSVVNIEASDEFSRLIVLPGTVGSAWTDLGFELYAFTQTIVSPNPSASAQFGASVFIDSEAVNLAVGAPQGNLYEPTIFDNGTTYFDDRSTTFFAPLTQSGAVFTYDYLPSANSTVNNPGKFVFGQQIYDSQVQELDQWGTSVSYVTGRLLVGSPGNDLGDSSGNFGRVGEFINDDRQPAWTVIRRQQPVVNVYQLNSVFMYDKLQSAKSYFFDFFDPLQGKILGAARQNINYIGALDPAKYNQGPVNNNGNFWAGVHVGEIWWDTTSARFIDPNQDDIVYASRRWGQLFPGSTVNIYQWTQSSVPPASYTGPGQPYNTTSWTIKTELNEQGTFSTYYYFWVTGLTTINTSAGKTLSTTGIARYIEDPRSSGIPYIAALNASTVAVYNGQEYLSAFDTILHISYDRELTDANVHTEFDLITAGKADSFLSSPLYRKLQDSFAGVDTAGAAVPDIFLSPAERYGVQFRPRQSMFVDRFIALENYLGRANTILKDFPVVETRQLSLLNSSEPEPTLASGAWDRRLLNIEELGYQDLAIVPIGYKYLIVSDSTNNGLWTIYTVIAGIAPGSKITQLTRVQNYDTRKYWYHIDWYQPGYNSATLVAAEVPVYSALDTIKSSTTVGASVRVTANAQGKWEIYQRTVTDWTRVGLQDGTLQFSEVLWNYALGGFGFDVAVFDANYFDQEPTTETRKIIQAINQELFINELAIFRNSLLILTFEVILTQFENPEWLTKTSLIDVVHNIRELVAFQTYRRDNQEFVLDYLQEVKPYHVQVKQFDLVYNGLDDYPGMLTDFDVPARWDRDLEIPQFVSPILLPYTKSTATGTGTASDIADTASNAEIWNLEPWTQWFNNYLLAVQDALVSNGGSGYTVEPQVEVTGTCLRPAQMAAIINSAGQVVGIEIIDPGFGYTTEAVLTLTGGNGIGATAYAVMGGQGVGQVYNTSTVQNINEYYNLVRAFKTVLKYDRYQYNSNIADWSYQIVTYPAGTQVRYANQVWQAVTTVTNTPIQTNATGTADSKLITVASTTGITQGQLIVGFNIANETYVDAVIGSTVLLTRVLLNNINQSVTFYNRFNPEDWTRVQASTLSGIDRTQGFYLPGPNMPGRSLPLVIDGLDYPGVQVDAPDYNQNTGFDVGNYDINPFDNISFGPEGRPTYDPGILDAIYESNYLDIYLGTRPTDINVAGGAYVDTYSSHAPEELVPGAEFDTLDFRVYTTPGSDWTGNGHGFPASSRRYVYNPSDPVLDFAGILDYPMTVQIFNVTLGLAIEPVSYDWANYEVTVGATETVGDIIDIYVTGTGGGNQLYNNSYLGNDIGNTVIIPFAYSEIYEFVIYNGETYLVPGVDYTWASESANKTRITFTITYGASDRINLSTLGYAPAGDITHSWSLPVFQTETSDGSLSIILTQSLQGTNPVNLIVTSNGERLRPSEGVEHTGDGITTVFALPTDGGYSQSLIADNDVSVYVDNTDLILNTDFVVDPWDGSTDRTVTLTTAPALGQTVLIAVRTKSEYFLSGNTLTFQTANGYTPTPGDIIEIVTWNDTSEQGILTQVFAGPTVDGNQFDTGRVILDSNRVLVSLNGTWLFSGIGYVIAGTKIEILGPLIGASDVVAITNLTQSVVPGAMAFRIFQDMRGVQATYRITPATTTSLVQGLSQGADIIYVDNAMALNEPNFEVNIWGVLTIDGERIMYRNRDTVNNTVSGLLRGTAGTAASSHLSGSAVYNMSVGNLLPEPYQNYVVSNIVYPPVLGDGTTTSFTASLIDISAEDSAIRDETVEVYVGGIRLQSGYTITNDNPVTVDFDEPPADGAEVTILVRRAVTWYAPGAGTPSDGVPLQDTDTIPARFLRGEI